VPDGTWVAVIVDPASGSFLEFRTTPVMEEVVTWENKLTRVQDITNKSTSLFNITVSIY
jgi:hypothetical protein